MCVILVQGLDNPLCIVSADVPNHGGSAVMKSWLVALQYTQGPALCRLCWPAGWSRAFVLSAVGKENRSFVGSRMFLEIPLLTEGAREAAREGMQEWVIE